MINERHMIQQGHGGIVGPKPTTTNPRLRRERRPQQQGAVPPPPTAINIIGSHWVIDSSTATQDSKKYTFAISCSRCNDVELQAD